MSDTGRGAWGSHTDQFPAAVLGSDSSEQIKLSWHLLSDPAFSLDTFKRRIVRGWSGGRQTV